MQAVLLVAAQARRSGCANPSPALPGRHVVTVNGALCSCRTPGACSRRARRRAPDAAAAATQSTAAPPGPAAASAPRWAARMAALDSCLVAAWVAAPAAHPGLSVGRLAPCAAPAPPAPPALSDSALRRRLGPQNPSYMLQKCPRSCGRACPKNVDANPFCSVWAGNGECKKVRTAAAVAAAGSCLSLLLPLGPGGAASQPACVPSCQQRKQKTRKAPGVLLRAGSPAQPCLPRLHIIITNSPVTPRPTHHHQHQHQHRAEPAVHEPLLPLGLHLRRHPEQHR